MCGCLCMLVFILSVKKCIVCAVCVRSLIYIIFRIFLLKSVASLFMYVFIYFLNTAVFVCMQCILCTSWWRITGWQFGAEQGVKMRM